MEIKILNFKNISDLSSAVYLERSHEIFHLKICFILVFVFQESIFEKQKQKKTLLKFLK